MGRIIPVVHAAHARTEPVQAPNGWFGCATTERAQHDTIYPGPMQANIGALLPSQHSQSARQGARKKRERARQNYESRIWEVLAIRRIGTIVWEVAFLGDFGTLAAQCHHTGTIFGDRIFLGIFGVWSSGGRLIGRQWSDSTAQAFSRLEGVTRLGGQIAPSSAEGARMGGGSRTYCTHWTLGLSVDR